MSDIAIRVENLSKKDPLFGNGLHSMFLLPTNLYGPGDTLELKS